MKPAILIKRIYEPVDKNDGYRILVDRLWPRGLKKEKAHIKEWAKSIAPSTEARVAFGHVPEHWSAFKQQYLQELQFNADIPYYLDKWENFPTITLLYAAKDEEHNHALVLQEYLEKEYQAE